MKTAYKIDEVNGGYVPYQGTTTPRAFRANDFSGKPEGQYVCTCCEGSVHFRNESRASGNNRDSYRPQCWVADNKDAHIAKNCTEISTADWDVALASSIPLNEAIADRDMQLLLRVNFVTRLNLWDFNRKEMTHERMWCRANKGNYKAIPCNSTDKIIQFLNKAFQNAPDGQKVMDRILVSHGGHTRKLSEVLLLSPEERRTRYNTLAKVGNVSHRNEKFSRGGFLCIVPLGVAYDERNNVGNGPKRTFNMEGDANIVKEVYCLKDKKNVSTMIGESGFAVSWPYLNKRNPGKLMWYVHGEENTSSKPLNTTPKKYPPTPYLDAAE
ncbi:MAG: hypothetical protein COB76_00215 [Alphaproteobacteria bacterium]|nr:MAG: hypothetical protein COB76_00215 [Alphaproteobacteria bacterium]